MISIDTNGKDIEQHNHASEQDRMTKKLAKLEEKKQQLTSQLQEGGDVQSELDDVTSKIEKIY